jgi:hypothetical protein
VLASAASNVRAAGVMLTIQNGLVSLDAQEVTVRQILTEWARVGKTRVVNVERLAGGPVTLKFERVPERQALDIILRSVPGYVAALRESLVADASIYDRILVMPTTTAVSALRQTAQPTPGFAPGMATGPNFTQLRPMIPPAAMMEASESALDQLNDPALAAAAAAGLMPVPSGTPGISSIPMPMPVPAIPGSQAQPAAQPPAAANPWNAPAGTAQPTFSPPPPAGPTPITPMMRPRPPQAPCRVIVKKTPELIS